MPFEAAVPSAVCRGTPAPRSHFLLHHPTAAPLLAPLGGWHLSQIKHTLIREFGFSDNVYSHLGASVCAGFLAVAAGSPFDVVKSRSMGGWVVGWVGGWVGGWGGGCVGCWM